MGASEQACLPSGGTERICATLCSMPSNLELVRSLYTAWEERDFTDISWADPEIEYVMAGGPDPGVWRGVRGMGDAFRGMLKAWTDWRVTADDYTEVDAQRILVTYHFSARGRVSGVEAGLLHTQGATLFHLHAGRVTRIVQYFNRETAFAEVGLAPARATERPR